VRYAHNGDVAIAYQVFGEGPVDLVCVPGFISNLYWDWELPEFSRMLTGLGSFARVVILDRRGVGLSDRLYPKDLPPLEVVLDDVVTVMDDAASRCWRRTGRDQAAVVITRRCAARARSSSTAIAATASTAPPTMRAICQPGVAPATAAWVWSGNGKGCRGRAPVWGRSAAKAAGVAAMAASRAAARPTKMAAERRTVRVGLMTTPRGCFSRYRQRHSP
jgi:pimeloyl-ACP methyl ester carboxylesterase